VITIILQGTDKDIQRQLGISISYNNNDEYKSVIENIGEVLTERNKTLMALYEWKTSINDRQDYTFRHEITYKSMI
jgi:hypothetical protein